jgi:thiol-disulfide isomerase/thioredoxin
VGGGVLVIVAIASVLLSGGSGGSGTLQAAPDFSLSFYQGEETLGGVELDLSDVTALGKPVVLNFWAGLCPPCRVEMPGFQRVHEARGNEITLLGIDVGPFTGLGSREDGLALLQQIGVTYPIASVSSARSVQAYRVVSMPTTVFITPDGRIVRRVSGAISEGRLSTLIDELIQVSQAPPPVETS